MRMFATVMPEGMERVSGSAPRLPMRMTLLTPRAMAGPSCGLKDCLGPIVVAAGGPSRPSFGRVAHQRALPGPPGTDWERSRAHFGLDPPAPAPPLPPAHEQRPGRQGAPGGGVEWS